MNKIDKTVKRETLFIASVVLILSALMQAVFLIIGQWDITVLLGNILGALAAVLNFLLLGITIQHATTKEEKDARGVMATSQRLRTLGIFVCAIVGAVAPCFNIFAALIPLFFPRIAMAIRSFVGKMSD